MMFDTVKKEGNKEYYYNKDGKLVFRFADDTLNYRDDELLPEVLYQINRARDLFYYPSRPMIDNIIEMQKEHKQKAVNYVKYRLLGECEYCEVFNVDFDETANKSNKTDRITQLEEQIKDLTAICQTILDKLAENS